jgi:hypothetical protein
VGFLKLSQSDRNLIKYWASLASLKHPLSAEEKNFLTRIESETASDPVTGCLDKVSTLLMIFFSEEGGYSNGYYTYVEGVVAAAEKNPKPLKWSTPKAKDELSPKGFENRGLKLYKDIQRILVNHGVNTIEIRYRDENWGAMEVDILFVDETVKKLPLHRLK